ncbi:SIMPL domain-containing protein [Paracoccus sanguinis]|uniref:SIMPL domain-containing protein n=1 Tax=Paracoccus sanguinis TaxID=1545044 RepID=UPI00051FED1D|nr:SIMPL domain-containing protein [Paracoccus sanguinis]KGJ16230.1 hypothetical protein IX55_15125 [Paracoccus sanguinis]
MTRSVLSPRSLRPALGGGLALALMAAPLLAQTAPPAPPMPMPPIEGHVMPMHAPAPATVTVTGEGQVGIAPDLATVALGVTTQAETAAKALADNATRQGDVIAALKAQGIAPEDLQTQGLNLSPMADYSQQGKPPVITGYQAQNIVSARVRDLAKLGPLLDAMVAAGATDVQGIAFSREDDAAPLDEARGKAVAEAQRRAETMAAAAGMALGPLVSLTEGGAASPPMPMAMASMARDAGGAATQVETGRLMLTVQVTGIWTLVPKGQ